jgi:hypothetical protein
MVWRIMSQAWLFKVFARASRCPTIEHPAALCQAGEEWIHVTALGKHVRTNPCNPWREIVGVVGDVHENAMSHPIAPTV